MNHLDHLAGTKDFTLPRPAPSEDSRLVEAVREFQDLLAAGLSPDRADFLARYPDLAEQLAPCLEGLLLLREALPIPSRTPPEGSLAGALLGDFRLLREMGRGGMGIVYEAIQGSLGRRVALKVLPLAGTLDDRQLQRFRNEAAAAAALLHPHIVQVHGVGCAEGVHYFAMQFIDGLSLAEIIRRLRAEPGDMEHFRRVAEWVRQAAEALEYAHSFGVIHRDVKPSNLLIDQRGWLYVADFGLAQVGGQDALTRTGDVLGTLNYMPPEQASGERVADPRRDVYALGVTLYELLTLRDAFTAGSRGELLRAVLNDEPLPARKVNPAVPIDLSIIASRSMAKLPADRYASAAALADDLRRWLNDQPITARPPTLRKRAVRWARRHPAVVAALVVAGLVGLAAAGVGALWREQMLGEERARQAVRAQQLNDALDEGEDHLGQHRPAAARASLGKAEALLPDRDAWANKRALQLKRNLDLLDTLEDIRLEEAWTDPATSTFDEQRAVPLYRAALLAHGLDRHRSAEQTAGEVIASPVASDLLAALERWSELTKDESERDWLGKILQAASSSEGQFVQRWRQAVMLRDRSTLQAMAHEIEAARFPAARLVRLARQLGAVCGPAQEVALLQRAQRAHAGDFWINHALGCGLLNLRPADPEGATRHLTAATALRPDSAGAWLNLGYALTERGVLADPQGAGSANTHFEAAAAACREAIRLRPDYSMAHNNLGAALKAQGKVDLAVDSFREAIRLSPGNAKAHNNLGQALKDQGRPRDAIDSYREAIRLAPGYANAHCNLGGALLDRGKVIEAVAICREAIRLEPGHADAHFHLGRGLLQQGKSIEAIAAYREAIRLAPGVAGAYANLGMALHTAGQFEAAVRACRTAIRLQPQLLEAHLNLGSALQAQGKCAKAETCIREAIRLNPRLAGIHYNLGLALDGQGKLDAAIAAYREAIRLGPEYPEAHCNLGLLLRKKGQYAGALVLLRRGHDLGSKRSDWRYPSLEWVRQAERAVILDKKLAAIREGKSEPADAGEGIELARLCAERGWHARATKFWSDAFAADPRRAADLRGQNRYDAACSAALAGSGMAQDALPSEEAMSNSRRQARDWLRADLTAYAKLLEDEPGARELVRQRLRQWQADADLTCLRDTERMGKLPLEERIQCEKLWAEVAGLLKRIGQPR